MVSPPLQGSQETSLRSSPSGPRPRIGDILRARGRLSTEQLATSLRRQRGMEVRLGDLLRTEAGLGEEDILSALEEQWWTRRLDLSAMPPDRWLMQTAGLDRCLADRAVPWRRVGGATVVATVYPDRFIDRRAEYEAMFGAPVMIALIDEQAFLTAISRIFREELRYRAECRLSALESCRAWPGMAFRRWMLGGLALGGLGALALPTLTLTLLFAVAVLTLIAVTALKLAACLGGPAITKDDARSGAEVVALVPPRARQARRPTMSLLVPLYREARIAGRLLTRLARIDYPPALLDICLVVEAEDFVTRNCLARLTLPPNVRVIEVPPGSVRTKPRALNFALDHCRGSLVGVYDAEDMPDRDQIRLVVDRFARAGPELGCLQGRLTFYNRSQNVLARMFTLDYAIWFSVILPGLSRLGLPIPLGGTTIFFRREVLEQLGRWDAFNVTEDADLGIRLARRGYRTELLDTETQEEAACGLWAWIKQRSRWLKGYAMTYATHMRDPVRLRRELGWRGFLGFQVLFLGTLAQTLLAPMLWSWWLIFFGWGHPVAGLMGTVAVVAVTALFLFCEAVNWAIAALALRRVECRGMLPWIPLLNPYFMLSTLAALKAVSEMVRKPFFWDKTEHGRAPDPLDASSRVLVPMPPA